MKTIREIWKEGVAILKNSSPSAQLDAQVLLCFILGVTKEYLWTNLREKIEIKEGKKFLALIEKRKNKTPIAYLIQEKEFYGLNFYVDERVLIPRPDTEILIENALEIFQKEEKILSLWDIGTGSGAIGLALAKNLPDKKFHLVDISSEALEVTKKNKEKLKLSNVSLYEGNLLNLWEKIPPYSIIVANLPYLTEEEVRIKEKEYPEEPSLALLGGGEEGLNLIYQLLEEIIEKKQGKIWVFLESSTWQIPLIYSFMKKKGFQEIKISKDLSFCDRIIQGCFL